MPNLATISAEHLSIASYPRTGKRGVPQQFARRLYEMLQSETKLAATTPEEGIFIQWSESGQAFRILDVKGFTSTVLPKYFRTKKFSSFQRNLNLVSVLDSQTERFSHFWSFTFSLILVLLLLLLLFQYGFSKVRRGPDTDMYAHPSFIRGKPELLSELRKCSSAVSRRKASRSVGDESDVSTSGSWGNSTSSRSDIDDSPKAVTPVTPPKTITHTLDLTQAASPTNTTAPAFSTWAHFQNRPLMPKTMSCQAQTPAVIPGGIGRLDLLALAVEHAT
jgi:HSF-type DNA-binding